MTLHFADLHPGMRVLLPVRHDIPHTGPYLIRQTREFWDGTWEIEFAAGHLVVTRRFPPAAAMRGALLADHTKDTA